MSQATEKIEQQELMVVVNSKPAILSVNFEELKAHLEKELIKYDVVVTVDTVKDAKELAKEMNKMAGDIDNRRKEEVASVSEPIKKFDSDMKELVTMCKDGRVKLLDQVKQFEDETRKTVCILLSEARAELFLEHEVKLEFETAKFNDLILISNITAKGNLTKSAMDTLSMRVRDDRAQQDRVEMRLVKLENASYKAGLIIPLTKGYILRFLNADDEVYEQELQKLLDVEIVRQEDAEKVMRAKIEKEKQDKIDAEQEKVDREKRLQDCRQALPQAETPVTPEPEPKPAPAISPAAPAVKKEEQQVDDGKTLFVITAVFEITAPSKVAESAIEEKLKGLLESAGITSLTSIKVCRNA